jgi:hypothetical protein
MFVKLSFTFKSAFESIVYVLLSA